MYAEELTPPAAAEEPTLLAAAEELTSPAAAERLTPPAAEEELLISEVEFVMLAIEFIGRIPEASESRVLSMSTRVNSVDDSADAITETDIATEGEDVDDGTLIVAIDEADDVDSDNVMDDADEDEADDITGAKEVVQGDDAIIDADPASTRVDVDDDDDA